jgi:hypothetical protein
MVGVEQGEGSAQGDKADDCVKVGAGLQDDWRGCEIQWISVHAAPLETPPFNPLRVTRCKTGPLATLPNGARGDPYGVLVNILPWSPLLVGGQSRDRGNSVACDARDCSLKLRSEAHAGFEPLA